MVVKRTGSLEPFDPSKIKNSLAAASDELGQPLNHADLNHLCEALCAQLEGRERVSSKEVLDNLLVILAEENFTSLASAYEKNVRNVWNSNPA